MATKYIEIFLEKIDKNYFLETINNKKMCHYQTDECNYYSKYDYGSKKINQNEFNEKIYKNYNCVIMLKEFSILNFEIEKIQLIVQQNENAIDVTFNFDEELLFSENKKLLLDILCKKNKLTKDKKIYIGYEPVEDKDMQSLMIFNGEITWINDKDTFWNT